MFFQDREPSAWDVTVHQPVLHGFLPPCPAGLTCPGHSLAPPGPLKLPCEASQGPDPASRTAGCAGAGQPAGGCPQRGRRNPGFSQLCCQLVGEILKEERGTDFKFA